MGRDYIDPRLAILEQALADVKAGRVMSDDEFRELVSVEGHDLVDWTFKRIPGMVALMREVVLQARRGAGR